MSAIRQDLISELPSERVEAFRMHVLQQGRELYRDLPWRRTHNPYEIWLSEVMLQQTQVSRVDGRWQRWLKRFPTLTVLAEASTAEVLEEWQGMGYNRRALALQQTAQILTDVHGLYAGSFPQKAEDLIKLPGVGPATAAGIRAFAWNLPAIYLETNVRTVFLHELFPGEYNVADTRITPLVQATCPVDASDAADDPRTWYYALLDYGAHLKAILPNPSRRSRSHTRQSRFEGSHRQRRAELVRLLLTHSTEPISTRTLAQELSSLEEKAGRLSVSLEETSALLGELSQEGFCSELDGLWII